MKQKIKMETVSQIDLDKIDQLITFEVVKEQIQSRLARFVVMSCSQELSASDREAYSQKAAELREAHDDMSPNNPSSITAANALILETLPPSAKVSE